MKTSPEYRRVQKLAGKVDHMETLNIHKLVTTIEAHYPTMVKNYAEANSKRKKEKEKLTLKTLFQYAPQENVEEFNLMYRSLNAYAGYYARSKAKPNIKGLAAALQLFLKTPNHQALQDLKKLAEKVEHSKTETKEQPTQKIPPRGLTNNRKNSHSVSRSSPTAKQEQPTHSAVATEKQITPPVPSPALPLSITPVQVDEANKVPSQIAPAPKKHVTFSLSNEPPLPPPSSPSEQPSCSKERKQLPIALDHRLNTLINKIEEQERKFREEAKSLLAVGKGKKADAIQATLENTKNHFKSINVENLCDKDLFKSFLSYHEEGQKSIFEALNIQRLSLTRRNGNSLFFNDHANSLSNLLKSIENGTEIDAEIMQERANQM